MALSLVLDLIGGEVFQLFSGSVTRAVDRKAAFRDLLQDIKYTLKSLRRQARVIQQIQQYNLDLSLSNNEIIDIVTQMTKGRELIDCLSGIKFRLWNFCCTNDCAEQLKELNRALESLFDTLQLEQVRDAKETLKLARQNHKDLKKMKVMLEKILQMIDDPEVKGLLRKLVDQNSGDSMDDASTSTPTSNSASGSNTEDEGNGVAQASSSGLVGAAFGLLIDAVIEVKVSTKMFRPLLRRLKSTLDCLRPFIEEMAEDKKLLDRPKEKLENLRIQMENGVELIHKCSSVCRWTSNKKDKYTNQVFELDERLQGHLSILIMEVARDVRETSDLIRNIQKVINRIEGSDFQGSCDITEPPIPPVELEGLNMQKTSNVKETLVSEVNITEGSGVVQNRLEFKGSCDVLGPSSPTVGLEESKHGRKDLIKETLQRESVFPKRPGQPECLFYMRTGDCKFGVDCRYHHPDCVFSPTGLPLQLQETMPNFSELSNMSPLIVGLDVHLKELKRKLLNHGESSILVLTGPAGCGKSTLAKAFCQDEEVKDKFKDNIFFVTVSKKLSIDLIALQILCQLKDEVPQVENQVTAVEWLGKFLKEAGQDPLLLVLDDVWHVSEFLDNNNELKTENLKILVTSRSELRGFGSPYYINALSEEEAMTLIRRSAFLEDRSSYVPEDILRKIVKHCKGNALALTVIGRSLCRMPIHIWQKRVEELLKDSSISNCESDLLSCLKISYNALAENSVLKECFLDLSLFPEYQRVPADALTDMWAELYGLGENILPIMNLQELTTRGLAKLVGTRKEKVEVDGYYSTLCFNMHDIIRELAIHLTSQKPIEQRNRLHIEILGGKLPHWINHLLEQKYQPMKARLVSISTDEVFSQKWHNMQLPEAEVLVLNFQTENYALPEFVQNMGNLKVLIVTSCGTLPAFWPVGFLPAQLSNFQLLSSLPNLRTIRLEGISISSISMHSIQLKSLQKISLFNCRIGQTFSNTSIQLSDAFPNLVETNIDHCNDLVALPGICDLVNLKKLSLISCHYLSALPPKIGKLSKLEVLRLKSCTVLEMLPGSIVKLNKLVFLDLSYCKRLKELPDVIGLRNLKTIDMRQCSRLQMLPPSFLYLKQLQEVICDEETEKLWKPLLPRLKNLRIKFRFREIHF
ncbi:probable disease resistance protein At5g66900 isoform X2 [Rosa chinensis]|uniref:probable disease resistance protein At5g66900 isoform X2 n=1 Tax=Rosa chinensis TaxID=74649 RepID=UPI001AD8E49D|nr:probable disease resistance protein At5g66900 isoform X2 [Rosa chinensis]